MKKIMITESEMQELLKAREQKAAGNEYRRKRRQRADVKLKEAEKRAARQEASKRDRVVVQYLKDAGLLETFISKALGQQVDVEG